MKVIASAAKKAMVVDYDDDLKNHLEFCASLAGEYYNLRIPIAAEGKIGSTWADVH